MRRAQIIASIVLGAILLIIAGAIAAWHFDVKNEKGVAQGVTLAGSNIDGIDHAQLETKVHDLAVQYRDAQLTIGHSGRAFTISTRAVELEVDEATTVRSAWNIGRKGSVAQRIGKWMQAKTGAIVTPVHYSINESQLTELTSFLDPGLRTKPVEPTIEVRDNKVVPVASKNGEGLSANDALKALPDALIKGLPLQLNIQTAKITPKHTDNEAIQVAQQGERAASKAIAIKVGDKTASIPPETIRKWETAVFGDHLSLGVNDEVMRADLRKIIPEAGTPPVNATWIVENDIPKLTGDKPGTECCDTASVDSIKHAIETLGKSGEVSQPIQLNLRLLPAVLTPLNTPDMTIKEKVGEFTTHHAAGQNRVRNIHRIADMVKGHVIKPGETFSLNEFVGPRTTEKGFFVDGVIENGKFSQSVGGGISQFATTIFNAAFFAGLDFGEYQSHSIYISRYPYGREATISFPHPDLQIKNTTPHEVLIWSTYTETQITVSLYSTKHVSGEQTGQSTGMSGHCTLVTTERTRKYTDGKSEIDHVKALYQPAEGIKC